MSFKLLICLPVPVIADETEIVQPFLLGCDTKSLRVVQISLTGLQRLINNEALSEVCIYQLVVRWSVACWSVQEGIFKLTLFNVSTHWIFILDNDPWCIEMLNDVTDSTSIIFCCWLNPFSRIPTWLIIYLWIQLVLYLHILQSNPY